MPVMTAAGYEEPDERWCCTGCGEQLDLALSDMHDGPFCGECWAEHEATHGPPPGAPQVGPFWSGGGPWVAP